MAPEIINCSQDIWKAQKRISNDNDNDRDDGTEGDLKSPGLNLQQSKRFKIRGTASEEAAVEDLKEHYNVLSATSQLRTRCPEVGTLLSPITEISNYLTDTYISSSQANKSHDVGLHKNAVLNNTPRLIRGPGNRRNLIKILSKKTVEETSKKVNDNKSSVDFKSSNSGQMGHLNMDLTSSLHDMAAADELSLYVDDDLGEGSNSSNSLAPGSPPMMGLLSPEGSPRRFQIVSRKSMMHNRSATTTTTATANTASATTPNVNGQLRSFHSLSSCSMDSSSIDDEYMELIEMESLEQPHPLDIEFPAGLNRLISGQIVGSSQQQQQLLRTPETQRPTVRRCLSMTDSQLQKMQLDQQQQQEPKTPELLRIIQDSESTTPYSSRINETTSATFKRPDPPTNSESPVQIKRLRSTQDKENLDNSFSKLQNSKCISSNVTAPRPVLRKSMSMNDAQIMTALARSENGSEPDLIGDFSKPFALPLMDGRHRDLKSISSDTVARLIKGDFVEQVASYKIIDCRYPYEFEGGHIRGALNLYTQEQIVEEFLQTQQQQQKTDLEQNNRTTTAIITTTNTRHKRNIIIFHCEFSSERGPKLSRFLRNHDRARNTNAYPALDYPEIYLLHNGYKEFYQTHAELCDPIAYRPMLEPSYSEAYRHFRAKSKSWNGDGCGGATSRHMKKSRSRLML